MPSKKTFHSSSVISSRGLGNHDVHIMHFTLSPGSAQSIATPDPAGLVTLAVTSLYVSPNTHETRHPGSNLLAATQLIG